jgi:hypothetical protein
MRKLSRTLASSPAAVRISWLARVKVAACGGGDEGGGADEKCRVGGGFGVADADAAGAEEHEEEFATCDIRLARVCAMSTLVSFFSAP